MPGLYSPNRKAPEDFKQRVTKLDDSNMEVGPLE